MTRLVHMHIPKSAGTSLLSMLRKWYGTNNVLRYDYPVPSNYSSHSVLSGHFPYDENFFDFNWITFVRHPIDRLQSFYHYTNERGRKSSRNYWWNIIKDMTLEDWLESDYSKNHMLKQFAGKRPQDKLEDSDIEKAYENARCFFFIGFQERFSDDVIKLAKKINKPEIKVARMLPSKNPGVTTKNLYGNELDFELYNYLLSTWSNTS